jgi:hypothetical protein
MCDMLCKQRQHQALQQLQQQHALPSILTCGELLGG